MFCFFFMTPFIKLMLLFGGFFLDIGLELESEFRSMMINNKKSKLKKTSTGVSQYIYS